MKSAPQGMNVLLLAEDDHALQRAVRNCGKLLNRRAIMAAAASAVPVPGLDWAVDAALLSNLIPAINAEFGLTPKQLDQLPTHKRDEIQKAVTVVGSMLIGRLITKDLILSAARHIGVRLTAKQATKYVPFAGQAASALMGYLAIRYFGNAHIADCVRVVKATGLPPVLNAA